MTTLICIETGKKIKFDFCLESMFNCVSFKARTTAKQFKEKAAINPRTADDEPTLLFRSMKLYMKCDGLTDLIFFINLFLEGGNNVPKILQRVTTPEAAIIRQKCAAYGINHSIFTQKCVSNKDLTLSRIARAYSVHTAIEILKTKSRGILTSKLFQQDLPLVMQHTIFAGLIPVRQFTDELKSIAMILNMEVNFILASREEKVKMESQHIGLLIDGAKKYVEEDRAMYDDVDKLRVLTEAGILNKKDNGEFELSAVTIELVNQLPAIKTVYSFKYSEAVEQLKKKYRK